MYLATDTKPEGIKRRVDSKYLSMFQSMEESTNGGSAYASHYEEVKMTEEQKQALQILSNKQQLFKHNE